MTHNSANYPTYIPYRYDDIIYDNNVLSYAWAHGSLIVYKLDSRLQVMNREIIDTL